MGCTAGKHSQEYRWRTRPEGEGGNDIGYQLRIYSSELSRLEAQGGNDDGYQYRVCSSELARLEAKGDDDDEDQCGRCRTPPLQVVTTTSLEVLCDALGM